MLLIPQFRTIEDVTVYADDELWYRFYLVPSVPRVRVDDQGRPVFLLVKYAFGDEDRERNSELPLGGGYLAFDAQLRIPDDVRARVEAELQDWVDAEAATRADVPEPPKVLLADPTWASGIAKMYAPQDEHLVEHRVAEQPASLLANNTAVFNLDLTEAGATFMQKLLTGDGDDGTDLTPLQVVYDLTMWSRLPPVTIKISADSQHVYNSVQKLEETDRDNPCTPAEIETYRETGVNSASLVEQGVVTIQIDKGDASIDDDALDELREYALELFDTMVQQKMLEPAPQEEQDLSFEDDFDDDDGGSDGWVAVLYPKQNFGGDGVEITEDVSALSSLSINDHVSSVKVRSGHRVTLYHHGNYQGKSLQLKASSSNVGASHDNRFSSVRIWRPPQTRYRVRKTYNQATMSLDVELTQTQTIEWPMVVQGTLHSFLSGMSAAELREFVREVRLDDPMFQTLGLEVRALADFENEPISAVQVEVQYPATGSDHTVKSFTFEAGVGAQSWQPTLRDGEREYRHRHRVIYADVGEGEWTAWERSESRGLNIAIADPGRLQVEVSAGHINFEVVKAMTVELTYEDAARGIELLTKTLVLDKANPTRSWSHQLFKPVDEPIRATVVYHLDDGSSHEGDVLSTRTGTIVVPSPHLDILDVALVPSGQGWADVAHVVVALRYEHPDGIVADRTFQFSKLEEFATWQVRLKDPTRRRFEYQVTVVYTNQPEAETRPWVSADGDQTIPIHVPGPPKLQLAVNTALVDFAVTPVVTVFVQHAEGETTLAFTAPGAQTWVLELSDADVDRGYRYTVTYHTTDGGQTVVGPEPGREQALFVPKLKVPEAGKLGVTVRGQLVDYAVTPLVEVVLTYSDAANGVDETGVITLADGDETAKWEIDIVDNARRTFEFSIRYFLPDGTPVDGDSGSSHIPNLIIRAHQPE